MRKDGERSLGENISSTEAKSRGFTPKGRKSFAQRIAEKRTEHTSLVI